MGGKIVPGFGAVLDKALASEVANLEKDLLGDGDPDAHVSIPREGLAADSVLVKAQTEKAKQASFEAGQKWGGIYRAELQRHPVNGEAAPALEALRMAYNTHTY